MKHIRILCIILLVAVSFGFGVLYSKYSLLVSKTVVLNQSLILQAESEKGKLPKGAVLYPYSQGPNINTYVVFVNTKNINALTPVTFDNMFTVSPIDAYTQ